MIDGKAGDPLGGLTKRLFVLFLLMVIAGFAIPSPGVSVPDASGKGRQVAPFRPLAKPARPEVLIIPAISVSAPITPIDLDPYGGLTPPWDVTTVGWWRQSAKPGARQGQTLITGHTVHSGGGALDDLGEVRPGDLVKIRTARGTLWYRTTKVFVYSKEKIAENANELFGQDRKKNRLVLVTCTNWDGTAYLSNTIVLADPLGVPRKATRRAIGNATAL